MDLKLLQELTDYVPIPKRPDGFGITIIEFAEANHCSVTQARTMLQKAVEDGILAVHMMVTPDKSAKTAVYHRPGDWPPK